VTWILLLFAQKKSFYFGVAATVLLTLKLPFAVSQTTKDVRVVGFVAPLVARLHVQYSTITTTSPHQLVFFACGCSLKGMFTGTTEPSVT
jgi:hypothetical protein